MNSKHFPIIALAIIPLLIAFGGVFLLANDSPYIFSNFLLSDGHALLAGRPTIEPNTGITSFALGHRAALDLFSGKLPLWDHHEGLGAPLLGGMQAAALFPPTWLLVLNHGQFLEHPLLQFIAGVGAYLFFRRFGLSRAAALTGGLLFEVNGVFSWLRNAIFNPVAFLPWLLLSVECLRVSALERHVWKKRLSFISLGALSGAMAIYAGFPEVTYLYAILVAAWTVFRMWGLSRDELVVFARDLTLTALLSIALCSPALISFAAYLPESFTGGHEGEGFYGQTQFGRAFIHHFLPYIYGPIWASFEPLILSVWGGTGGYIGLAPLVVGLGVLFLPGRLDVKAFLCGAVVVGLGVSYGLPGVYQTFMLLPLVKLAACYRYLNAAWIFCIIFLTALFIDEFPKLSYARSRFALGLAAGITCVGLALAGVYAWPLLALLWGKGHLFRGFAIGSILLAVVFVVALFRGLKSVNPVLVISGVLVTEATLWFTIPFLSYPRRIELDRPAIAFLQSNLGLQRMMASFGAGGYGMIPNYNSAFGLSSLNYDNLPVPARTIAYIREHLDPLAGTGFLPWEPERTPERSRQAVERLSAYARAGVKYVVAGAEYEAKVPAVYSDRLVTIYQIPGVRDYFSAEGCVLTPHTHDLVDAVCDAPSKLTRLEAHMSGWTARVNGKPSAIALEDGTFEVIDLPSGRSQIAFRYMPRGLGTAFLAAGIALTLILLFGARALRDAVQAPRNPERSSLAV